MRRGSVRVALLLTLAGCGGDGLGGDDAAEAEIWSLEVVHQIGSIEDVDQSLTRIGTVVIGGSGELFVAQPSDANVRVYEEDASLRSIIGQRGEGPAEIGGLSTLGLTDGQLWILDTRNRKVLRFTPEGEFLRSNGWSPESIRNPPVSLVFSTPWFAHFFADGRSLVSPSGMLEMRVGEDPPDDLPPTVVMTVDAEGKLGDTVAVLDQPVRDMPPREWAAAVPSNPLHALDAAGDGVILVERGSTGNPNPGTFRVARVDLAGDTVFDRSYSYTPMPTPEGTEARRLERFSEQMQEFYRDTIFVTENLPPISDLVVTQDGTIWLAREAEAQDSVAWWALDPDSGDHMGTIHLPAGHEIVAGQGDVLVAKRTDEFDVPYLVRYRVVR